MYTWWEELTHWKRLWCWEGLGAGGEGDNRGWDGWMASPTRWTWVWVNSRSWWWTGRPGVLRFMGSQKVGHDWVTDLIWSDLIYVEGGIRTGTILKAGLHLGPECGLRAICPISMEMTNQLENQAPGRKSPRALHHLKEYPNYLCNQMESYILLCLFGYDHRPIDNCPVLTT